MYTIIKKSLMYLVGKGLFLPYFFSEYHKNYIKENIKKEA